MERLRIGEEERVERLRIEEELRIAEEERIEKLRIAEEERIEKLRNQADEALAIMNRAATTHIILDSNIWMTPGYDALFRLLEDILPQLNIVIHLYGAQYDEICNVKKKAIYGTVRARAARCAIGRIERLQIANLLLIKPITIDATPGVYADPLIIKLIGRLLKEGNSVTFVSDDVELRTRTRAFAGPQAALSVYNGDDLLPGARAYCQLKGESIDVSPVERFYEEIASEDKESI